MTIHGDDSYHPMEIWEDDNDNIARTPIIVFKHEVFIYIIHCLCGFILVHLDRDLLTPAPSSWCCAVLPVAALTLSSCTSCA